MVVTINANIEKQAKRMFFREPALRTSLFDLSLYDDCGTRFYSQRTKDGDLYQFGYHRAISYRENCYHCSYACSARNGDLTFAANNGSSPAVAYDKFGVLWEAAASGATEIKVALR